MKVRPILFSAPMVRGLLEGRKTQTRRVVKNPRNMIKAGWSEIEYGPICSRRPHQCPYGQPGDLLWVKESYRFTRWDDDKKPSDIEGSCWYNADGSKAQPCGGMGGAGRLRPSIHMPRWASRLTLLIIDARVERLWDISESDADDEGVIVEWPYIQGNYSGDGHRAAYKKLWKEINGDESWESNPWVWAITFQVHKCNVYQLIKEAVWKHYRAGQCYDKKPSPEWVAAAREAVEFVKSSELR